MAAVRYWDRQHIDLDTAVVMPDHVHMIFRMRSGASLSEELHGIKGFSAREINRLKGHRGAIWMDESFDHIVRNEDEWEQKIEHVRQNPITRGLAKVPADYRWLWVAPEISKAGITG
jgi:REP element-mobilizing transposase RayT